MRIELIRGLVMKALERGFFQRAVHPLDLAVGPGVGHQGATVLNVVRGADGIEQVRLACAAVGQLGELHAVVGQHSADAVRYRRDDPPSEARCQKSAARSPPLAGPWPRGAVRRRRAC